MPPNFLLPESTVKGDGVGPKIDLGQTRGKLLVLTLGITSIVERESLEVSIWGSEDGDTWGTRPLATFPLKFYCGLYSILLNLAGRAEIRFLRGQWKMSRWSKGAAMPMLGFYLYAEQSGSRVTAAAAFAPLNRVSFPFASPQSSTSVVGPGIFPVPRPSVPTRRYVRRVVPVLSEVRPA